MSVEFRVWRSLGAGSARAPLVRWMDLEGFIRFDELDATALQNFNQVIAARRPDRRSARWNVFGEVRNCPHLDRGNVLVTVELQLDPAFGAARPDSG